MDWWKELWKKAWFRYSTWSLVALLTLSFFLAPLAVGKITAGIVQEISRQLAIDKSSGSKPTIEFEKKYGSSHIVATVPVKITPSAMNNLEGEVVFLLDSKINNFFWNAKTEIKIVKIIGVDLDEKSLPPSMTIDSNFSFFRGILNRISINDYHLLPTPKRTTGVDLLGVEGELDFDYQFSPKLAIAKVGKLKYVNGINVYDFKDLNFSFLVNRDWGKIDLSIEGSANEVNTLEQSFGPIILELGLKNIDQNAWDNLRPELSKLAGLSEQDQMQKMMVLMGLMKYIPSLLQLNPILEITKLKIHTSRGDFTADAAVQIKDAKDGLSLSTFLNHLDSFANVKAPKDAFIQILSHYSKVKGLMSEGQLSGTTDPKELEKILLAKNDKDKEEHKKKAEEMVQTFLQKKYFIKDENDYMSLKFIYHDKKMTLNDNPFSFF